MRLFPGLGLLAVVVALLLASGAGQPPRQVEAVVGSLVFGEGACTPALPSGGTTFEPGTDYCIYTFFTTTDAGDTLSVSVTGATSPVMDGFSCVQFIIPCGAPTVEGGDTVTYVGTLTNGSGTDVLIDFSFDGCTGSDITLTATQTGSAPEVQAFVFPCEQAVAGLSGLQVFQQTCPTVGLPPTVDVIIPGNSYCLLANFQPSNDDDSFTVSYVSGAVSPLMAAQSCIQFPLVPCEGPTVDDGTTVTYLATLDNNPLGGDLYIDFTLDACDGPALTLNLVQMGSAVSDKDVMIDCQEAPAQGLSSLQVFQQTCPTVGLPPTVTTIIPGNSYCLLANFQPSNDDDSFTVSYVSGAVSPLMAAQSCIQFPLVPCEGPTVDDGTTVTYLATLDNNPLGGDLYIDFTLDGCDGPTLTFNLEQTGSVVSDKDVMVACEEEVIPPAPGDFTKYTEADDEVLGKREVFEWFIDVPASDGKWVVRDTLPRGFEIKSVGGPGAYCREGRGESFTCFGSGATTLTILVKASSKCGEYTNTATFFEYGAWSYQTASDTVTVESCDVQPDDSTPNRSRRWYQRD